MQIFKTANCIFRYIFVWNADYGLSLPSSNCYCVFLFFSSLFGLQLHLYQCLTGVRHYRGYLRHLPLYRPYLCTKHWLQECVTHWHVKHEQNFPPNWFPSQPIGQITTSQPSLRPMFAILSRVLICFAPNNSNQHVILAERVYSCEIVKLVLWGNISNQIARRSFCLSAR